MAVDHSLATTRLDEPGPDHPVEAPGSDRAGTDGGPSLDRAIAGLDALDEVGRSTRGTFAQRTWRATWPKLIAFAIILLVWQIAVWAHWKPYILQSPTDAGRQLWEQLGTSLFWQACWATAQQAVFGYALVIVIGGIVGTAVARIPVLRAGIGALITGMQTMPSVLWYPLAVMVFGVTWKAIILMMVLGAAPSVANGFISGIDQVPPGLLRAGTDTRRSGPLPRAPRGTARRLPQHSRRLEAGMGLRLACADGR